MNRYDNETLKLLAQRGPIGGRLIRGLLWAIVLVFIASILVFLVRFTRLGGFPFEITNLF